MVRRITLEGNVKSMPVFAEDMINRTTVARQLKHRLLVKAYDENKERNLWNMTAGYIYRMRWTSAAAVYTSINKALDLVAENLKIPDAVINSTEGIKLLKLAAIADIIANGTRTEKTNAKKMLSEDLDSVNNYSYACKYAQEIIYVAPDLRNNYCLCCPIKSVMEEPCTYNCRNGKIVEFNKLFVLIAATATNRVNNKDIIDKESDWIAARDRLFNLVYEYANMPLVPGITIMTSQPGRYMEKSNDRVANL